MEDFLLRKTTAVSHVNPMHPKQVHRKRAVQNISKLIREKIHLPLNNGHLLPLDTLIVPQRYLRYLTDISTGCDMSTDFDFAHVHRNKKCD